MRENCLQKISFGGLLLHKNIKVGIFVFFSEKHDFKEEVFGEKNFRNNFHEKIQILNQSAYNASDFEMKLFLEQKFS